jgi:DNA-binding NarL/FixJ family response regulator
MKRIRILLADDHAVIREGLRALLESEGDIEVVGEAQTGRQAVQATKQLRPAVVVMDIGMPLLNGLEASRQILKALPATRVLILSANADDRSIEQVVELGAAGYLLKQTCVRVLAQGIREVEQGNTFFSTSIIKRVRNQYQKSSDRGNIRKKRGAGLTPREREVLQLIAEGKANKQVAAELGISSKTADKHRENLMRKLGIHDVAGLTRYAMAAGMIDGDSRFGPR